MFHVHPIFWQDLDFFSRNHRGNKHSMSLHLGGKKYPSSVELGLKKKTPMASARRRAYQPAKRGWGLNIFFATSRDTNGGSEKTIFLCFLAARFSGVLGCSGFNPLKEKEEERHL